MQVKKTFEFLQKFNANSGTWVFAATLFNKLILFVIKLGILFYFEKAVYGQITYAVSIVAFFTPFVGLGSPSGLLRYGSIVKSAQEKKEISHYVFTQGLGFSLMMAVLLLPIVWFFAKDNATTYLFLAILCFRVVSLFLFNYQSVEMRIQDLNKRFAQFDLVNSLLLLAGALVLTLLFNAIGYILSLVLVPIFVFILYAIKFGWPQWRKKISDNISLKSFWAYSVWASFSNMLTETVFIVDTILIGLLMSDTAVAEYNVAGLIPINILILPIIFMKTDFPQIARNFKNRNFLKNYYQQFFILFLIVCTAGMLIAYFLGDWILSFFGKDYEPYSIFIILMLGASISILFRIPLTNMISAFGKTRFNTITGFITILADIGLNLYAIPRYGLIGAAWATTSALILSGLLSLIYFFYYLKKETI